jgi:hypothetical protein
MPHIIERAEGYEYTGPSGIAIRFPKDDAEILASIRAADPEAATVVQYQPKIISIPALRLTLAKLGHMNMIREGLTTLGEFDRELFEHGATCHTNGTLCTGIRDLAKMNESQWRSVLVMTEAVEKAGLTD